MADDIPPPPSDSEDAVKSDTIRITLPQQSDQPVQQKRETVRINLPGRPANITPAPMSAPTAPKKETTKIVTDAGAAAPPVPAPPSSGKPFIPPPPGAKPPGAMPPRPPSLSGANPPPKPPSLAGRPTLPLKPMPAAPATSAAPEAVMQKAASPKKETARIHIPPEAAKAAMPKATVKMQTTQPLARQPSAMQAAPVFQPSTALALAEEAGPDSAMTMMSIAALIVSLAALGLSFWVYSQSSL